MYLVPSSTVSAAKTPVRLGVIAFINTLPVYGDYRPAPGVTLTAGTPTQLNEGLLKGTLDLSPISSAWYLAHKEQLVLLKGLSVSSFGAVNSVLLLAQKPLDQLTQLAVPDDSATSIALLQLFWQQTVGTQLPVVTYAAQNVDKVMAADTGVLVIGDRALTLHAQQLVQQPVPHSVTDLSAWWVGQTGLPFVFAVWAAYKPWYVKHRNRVRQIMADLCHSRNRFYNDPQIWAHWQAHAVEQTGLPAQVIAAYWQHALNYQWSAQHYKSLVMFEQAMRQGKLVNYLPEGEQ
jgi:chorismate dehydratase